MNRLSIYHYNQSLGVFFHEGQELYIPELKDNQLRHALPPNYQLTFVRYVAPTDVPYLTAHYTPILRPNKDLSLQFDSLPESS